MPACDAAGGLTRRCAATRTARRRVSERAIAINTGITRAFVKLRALLAPNNKRAGACSRQLTEIHEAQTQARRHHGLSDSPPISRKSHST